MDTRTVDGPASLDVTVEELERMDAPDWSWGDFSSGFGNGALVAGAVATGWSLST
ncbi:daptide-type RiPP [Saccharothrix sp. NPDC042600]|uniref:daptide-type RiPP n=1 Tax=Saccharothrix TaxID=2071 RepID=UPI0034008B59|nr:hypothetical protein GCM10017745_45470 [Saccharothrix mutabilis subsp. capreolus]